VKLPGDLLAILLKAMRVVVSADFTGKTVITIHWHLGQAKSTVTAIEEGQKLD